MILFLAQGKREKDDIFEKINKLKEGLQKTQDIPESGNIELEPMTTGAMGALMDEMKRIIFFW